MDSMREVRMRVDVEKESGECGIRGSNSACNSMLFAFLGRFPCESCDLQDSLYGRREALGQQSKMRGFHYSLNNLMYVYETRTREEQTQSIQTRDSIVVYLAPPKIPNKPPSLSLSLLSFLRPLHLRHHPPRMIPLLTAPHPHPYHILDLLPIPLRLLHPLPHHRNCHPSSNTRPQYILDVGPPPPFKTLTPRDISVELTEGVELLAGGFEKGGDFVEDFFILYCGCC